MRWLGVFLIAATLCAQNDFRVQTKVVQVPVKVTDKRGRNIDGLTARDFLVRDDGVPQQVTLDEFGTGLPPVSLALLIQTAGISTPALSKIRRIGSMIQPMVLGPRGQAAIVTFDSEITWVQDFTRDDDKIRQAVNHLKPGGDQSRARMLDAIAAAANRMKDVKGRKMIVMISETRDRGSNAKFEEVLESVTLQGIQVFGAHYSAYATTFASKPKNQPDLSEPPTTPIDGSDPIQPPGVNLLGILFEISRLAKTNVVKAMTEATGGADFPFVKEKGIEKAIDSLGQEVNTQYLLSFPQSEGAIGLHKIEVLLPERPELTIRARRSYWPN